jgi:hypothetical protein
MFNPGTGIKLNVVLAPGSSRRRGFAIHGKYPELQYHQAKIFQHDCLC